MRIKTIKSGIINNDYLSQYIGNFRFVYFENSSQVEKYEQLMSGKKDNNTWMSWVSCKEKFQFPCWMMCFYVPHRMSEYGGVDDYTAIYMTPKEVLKDLLGVMTQVEKLL